MLNQTGTEQAGLENIPNLSPYNILMKKREGEKLDPNEIKWFIDGLLSGEVGDYQMSALLMAIFLNGFDSKETAALTDAMLYSGKVLDFDDIKVIDKHSTGGVGDKTSFILAPIAAACGVKVPMVAGRGLGHTGGTVDKAEAIKGFNTSLKLSEFSKQLETFGMVMMGQTEDIAPADKIIYSLRDVTATIDSIPLITASIMSKKLAEGASGIVMDIKTGQGAFLRTLGGARKLAKSLQETALRFDKNIMTIITDMNQPLGNAIGNSLEIIECIETLKGNGPKDLTQISLELAGGMIYLAKLAKTHKQGIKMAKQALNEGLALEKFSELIKIQGGDPRVIHDYSLFDIAPLKYEVLAEKAGYFHSVDTKEMGLHCVSLGGGREKTDDQIDFGVGLIMNKKIGQKVKEGESLVTIYHRENQKDLVKKIGDEILSSGIKLKAAKPTRVRPLIFESEVKWSQKDV